MKITIILFIVTDSIKNNFNMIESFSAEIVIIIVHFVMFN